MPFPLLVPLAIGLGAALWSAIQDATSDDGLNGQISDDGDGLLIQFTELPAISNAALMLHGRLEDGAFLKAGHPMFADGDGDFCLVKPIESATCDFYVAHGAVSGIKADQLILSVRLVRRLSAGAPVEVLREDVLSFKVASAASGAFSAVRYLRPLLHTMKSLAEVDGSLVREEVRFVREFITAQYSPSTSDLEELRQLLKSDVQTSTQEAAAGLRSRLEHINIEAIASLLGNLATVDGDITAQETSFLKDLLGQLGMPESDWKQFFESLGTSESSSVAECLTVLGLSGRPNRQELQAAWRKKMKDFHPDRYHSADLPESVKAMIAKQGAEINAAYAKLQKAFGYES